MGFSLRWLGFPCSRAPGHTGLSSCDQRALEHRFPSCRGFVALKHVGSPQSGTELMSLALADGFFTLSHQWSPEMAIFSVKLPWQARWASLVAWSVKNLPAIQEDPGLIPGWEDLLEKEMATHSGILAWRIPWTEEAGRITVHGVSRVGHDWATKAPPPPSQTIPQKTILWHLVLPRPCQI